MKITKINGRPITSTSDKNLQAAATLAYEALQRPLEVTVGTFNAAKAVMDAANEELFARL